MLPEDIYDKAPVVDAPARSVLVADLRIDNREELGAALGLTAAHIRELSDATILMRCLERWDTEALGRVVGDFAFAWWNDRDARLVLARDYLGQRPLHYHRSGRFFAFASMPKGLHALPDVPREPDTEAMAEFLALLPDRPGGSFFKKIESVPPGHFIEVTRERLRTTEYWRPDLTPIDLKSAADYDEALREQMDVAVESRLRGAGGRVGAHLSAGLDSATVAATAAGLLTRRGGALTAFTAVPRPDFDGTVPANVIHDEAPLARQVVEMYPNMDHVLVTGSDRSPIEGLDRYFFAYERPVLNLCNATWVSEINRQARGLGISVMLSGQRGNMGFSYDGMTLLPSLLARGRLIKLVKHGLRVANGGTRWRTIASQLVGPFLPRPVWSSLRRLRGKGVNLTGYTCLHPETLRALDLLSRARERGLDLSYRPRADGTALRLMVLRRGDLGNYNKGTLGLWGIDLRDPTADRRLVEFCLRVPEEQYLAGGMPRGFARRAFRDRLPKTLLQQRHKGYQGADWYEGLTAARTQVAEEVERLSGDTTASALVDVSLLQRLMQDWPTAGWERPEIIERYRLGLLRGLSAAHFVRRAAGSNA